MKKLKTILVGVGVKAYSKEIENMSQRTNSTSSTSSMTSRFVPLGDSDFDWDSIVVDDPKKSGRYNCAFSKVFVMDGGEKKSVSFEVEKQDIWGLSWSYKDMNKRDSANINGIQVKYPLTSFETRNDPTPSEQETQIGLTRLYKSLGPVFKDSTRTKTFERSCPVSVMLKRHC